MRSAPPHSPPPPQTQLKIKINTHHCIAAAIPRWSLKSYCSKNFWLLQLKYQELKMWSTSCDDEYFLLLLLLQNWTRASLNRKPPSMILSCTRIFKGAAPARVKNKLGPTTMGARVRFSNHPKPKQNSTIIVVGLVSRFCDWELISII